MTFKRCFNVIGACLLLSVLVLARQPLEASDTGALLALVNQARNAAGTPSLTMQSQLVAAAQRHSNDMATNNFLDHVGSDGSTFVQRINDAGYSWSAAAENILMRGDENASSAFNQWWNSTGHRDNMMNPAYCDIGIAHAQAGNGSYYYTMVLASSPGQTCNTPPAPGSTPTNTPIPGTTPNPTSGGGVPPATPAGTSSVGSALQAGPPAFSDGRMNSENAAAPVAIYFANNEITVWDINLANTGTLAFRVSTAEIIAALTRAAATGSDIIITQGAGNVLFALPSGELRVAAPELRNPALTYTFSFLPSRIGIQTGLRTPIPPTPTTAAGGAIYVPIRPGVYMLMTVTPSP